MFIGSFKKVTLAALGVLLLLGVVGCSAVTVKEYRDRTPELKPEEYFDGRVEARGIFENRNGKVTREFTGVFEGNWDGNRLTIDETLNYRNGETEERTWVFEKEGPNSYILRAENLVGGATGKAMGNALHLEYTIGIDVDGSTWYLSADDWMYRQDDATVINRATLTYWGFKAGELTIVYRKVS